MMNQFDLEKSEIWPLEQIHVYTLEKWLPWQIVRVGNDRGVEKSKIVSGFLCSWISSLPSKVSLSQKAPEVPGDV